MISFICVNKKLSILCSLKCASVVRVCSVEKICERIFVSGHPIFPEISRFESVTNFSNFSTLFDFCDSFHTGINNFMIFWKLKNIEKIQSLIANFQTDNVNIRQ